MSAFTLFPRYARFPSCMRPPARSVEDASIDYLPANYAGVEAAVDAKLLRGAEQVVLDLDGLASLDTERAAGLDRATAPGTPQGRSDRPSLEPRGDSADAFGHRARSRLYHRVGLSWRIGPDVCFGRSR